MLVSVNLKKIKINLTYLRNHTLLIGTIPLDDQGSIFYNMQTVKSLLVISSKRLTCLSSSEVQKRNLILLESLDANIDKNINTQRTHHFLKTWIFKWNYHNIHD